MVHSDSEFARNYAGKLVRTITTGSDKSTVESSITKIYGRLGLQAPKVIWCEDMFQFSSLPLILRLLSTGSSLQMLKFGSLSFNRDKSIQRLWDRASEFVGAATLGRKLNSRLTRLLADASQNLTMAANRALGQTRMTAVEEGLDENLGGCANWSMDNSVELTRSQCALRAKLDGPDSPLSTELLLGDAWGMWDLRWLAAHACATRMSDSVIYKAEAERTQVNEWVQVIQGGQAYLFFENVCFICQYPSTEPGSQQRGTSIPVAAPVKQVRANEIAASDWMRKLQESVVARFRQGKNMPMPAAA